MFDKKHLYTALGLVAFVVGGIVAQEKTKDVLELVERHLDSGSDAK